MPEIKSKVQNKIDRSHILQLIASNQNAFDLIYETYCNKVYRLAFKFLKNSEQSQEIVQECFINLWTSRDKLNPDGNIWLYLYVISKRLSLNALRQVCQSRVFAESLVKRIETSYNNTEEDMWVNDLENYTEHIINKLPRQQQLIFRMSRIEHLTHKEIADKLNISPNTVKNHMVEALKTLKSYLQYIYLTYLAIVFFWY